MIIVPKNHKGLTLVELIFTVAILAILASVILPTTQLVAKRNKELELRRNLRIIRTALDEYKSTYDKAVTDKKIIPSVNQSGYPETLKKLVEGDDFGGLDTAKKKFLRRIPADPFNPPPPGEEPKWGLRSYTDEPDSTSSDEKDVFDVYSLSEEQAIDGTLYKDW